MLPNHCKTSFSTAVVHPLLSWPARLKAATAGKVLRIVYLLVYVLESEHGITQFKYYIF